MEVGYLEPTPLAFLWLLVNFRKLYLPLVPLGPPLSFCLLPRALAAPETKGENVGWSGQLVPCQAPHTKVWQGWEAGGNCQSGFGYPPTCGCSLRSDSQMASAGCIPVYRCRITLEPRCDLSLRPARYTNAMEEPPWHTAAQAVCRLGWG